MGMNNVWYPFVEMASDPELKTVRPELRMNAYANHGGVDRTSFELYALAASIVGKCEFCIRSHYQLLRENGFTTQQLRDVGRIAAVVNAVAQVFAVEQVEMAESGAA
jgi:alkyl hydroperoxide reductase subunit D